jgi:hypothetical protein
VSFETAEEVRFISVTVNGLGTIQDDSLFRQKDMVRVAAVNRSIQKQCPFMLAFG